MDYDDHGEELERKSRLSDAEVEDMGSGDGESDSWNGMSLYSQYGSSVSVDDLSDEQKTIYDNAYHSAYDAAEELEDELEEMEEGELGEGGDFGDEDERDMI